VIPSAFLRAFRPLETFRDMERSDWERYILAGGPPPVGRGIYQEELTRDNGRVGLLAPVSGEHADIRLVSGRYYVCPWRTRLRILTSILSLRDTAPGDMVEVFVPESEMRRTARELARIRRREPGAVPSILQSPWHVPVRWFALVDEPERHLVETGPGSDRYRLFYWTSIVEARRRADRALRLLRRTELASTVELLRELAQWLNAFHPETMIELDYASVSGLFSWDELDDDHSGRDIQEAVRALADGGSVGRASELYQSVATRWADAMSRESMN
jgi:hypothetical protein